MTQLASATTIFGCRFTPACALMPAWHRCRRCGRVLTDAASIDRQYGTDCWKLLQEGAEPTPRERLTKIVDDLVENDQAHEGIRRAARHAHMRLEAARPVSIAETRYLTRKHQELLHA